MRCTTPVHRASTASQGPDLRKQCFSTECTGPMTMMRPQSDRSRPEYLGINRAPSGQGSTSQRTDNTDETHKADK